MPGGNKNKYDPLNAQLQPLIDVQKQISTTSSAEGITNVKAAKSDFDYVTNYLKQILTGSADSLLRLFDPSELTKSIDENEQQLAELGVRGGARAAGLGQASFDRSASINRVLAQLRNAAPAQIAQIAQSIGNLGLGELSASVGAGAQASNTLFGVEQLKQNDADRRAALLGSIFTAIGGVAGATLCVGIASLIDIPGGKIQLSQLEVGDKVVSFDDEGNRVIRILIRKRIGRQQKVRLLQKFHSLSASLSHVFYDEEFEEILCSDLKNGDTLFGESVVIVGEAIDDVGIIKLDNELRSYPFVANGFISADDDPIK